MIQVQGKRDEKIYKRNQGSHCGIYVGDHSPIGDPRGLSDRWK